MPTPANEREARLLRRFDQLTSHDAQLVAAQPDPTITESLNGPDVRLTDVIRTIMTGYADRPALGQRAVKYVTDATGRTVTELQPRFDTLTYRETWGRVQALAHALAGNPVRPGDRVATLGFISADYAIVDMALALTGAVAVPLQTSAPLTQLHPIVAETEPVAILSSIDDLSDAVELALTAHAPQRFIVFDFHPQVNDHREAFDAATARLRPRHLTVETLDDVIALGGPGIDELQIHRGNPDDLQLLIYTSGSTGAPKGAMYTDRLVAGCWRRWFTPDWDADDRLPAITVNFMPISHVMGRTILYSTLGVGGTAYFAARSDLSTLLDDLALVRPTRLDFVPRIWEMLFQEVQSEVEKRLANSPAGANRDAVEHEVMTEKRENLIGGRQFAAMTGSAPTSPELRAWVEDFIDVHLVDGYGATEAGVTLIDGRVQRPPVTDYKLVDVPDLGYFTTDRPYPRGELYLRSTNLIPGYYKRPDVTAELFDADGWYHTGDVMAETGPDQLQYVDRRNNVLKLSQGEFVTVSKLEAVYGGHPSIRQIFVYGNSARSYVLAVIVPTDDALVSVGGDVDAVKSLLSEALQSVAREAGLQSYEIPRDFLVETRPFTLENGLLTGIRKLARPQLKEYYGPALEGLYTELADSQAEVLRELRQNGADGPVLETVTRAAEALLGAAAAHTAPDTAFTDLGGDSLSALTFANLLHDIFAVDVPVGVIVSPASDLASIAAYIEAQRTGGAKRPTYDAVHGRDATEVHARDLTLDKFLDATTLAAAADLPGPSGEIRTVLLTGATGFLGRYLALQWLERMNLVGGTVIALVRAKDDDGARARLDATFDSGDPNLLAHYRELAADHLKVLAGDKGEADLGLRRADWQRLADTVDLIVDPAALVNHVLPYRQLFGPNVVGTAELIRVALTTRIKPYVYVSTIGVGDGIAPGRFVEDADIRQISATRSIDDSYANGYGNSKWAGEVLLREAHDLAGLPVSVFRCDMIMADTSYAGQLNVPDMFTRLMLSLAATGIAPNSFYELDAGGSRQRAHFDGLPVEFIADAISTLGAAVQEGFETYHVMNPHDDAISLDTFVDWLIEAGYPITRVPGYAAWLERFETALRALPEKQRQASLLPLIHNYQKPEHPINGSLAPADHFRAAVQEAKIGPDKDIPHLSAPVIVKYLTDLELLGLL
ncbi:carboxylic acid reductase [Mycolicibacterium litorale]|uniref:Carboxylic acid reductase n=1 Tax=Mycolicibacterium litorale TaxID=758802 RepID=A0AAD1IMP5_9MYCO|nr:carboxylic acid reductase [Mycolicibacterium litorale]MCV7416544.1 carboxylic acid reductase [Mycolicibacterium litorale]TDY09795.1 fatty acid CoA ligase FadD9 [Mycolicibacterium litorale]BBY17751.1 oxidoreductase [Mycolicibacterium litorale]